MRIAQVAPLLTTVPPTTYGGTERVVATLTEELVRRGHEVVLFAAAGSSASAELRPGCPVPLWSMPAYERRAYEAAQVEEVVEASAEFDVIHAHIEYLHWLAADRLRAPVLTTLHGRLDGEGVGRIFARHRGQPLVSISHSQRLPLEPLGLNWIATIHHGLRLPYPAQPARDGDFLVFVGRSTPDKDLATALRVAIRCGMPIKVAAHLDLDELEYHRREVVPLLDHPLIEWLGEVGEAEKLDLLQRARALLMPVNWNEPFGLSFLEALALGTPVITRPRGALPELMVHGEHCFFGETEDELVDACLHIDEIDREACSRWAADRFSIEAMVDRYEVAYARVLAKAGGEDAASPVRDAGGLVGAAE